MFSGFRSFRVHHFKGVCLVLNNVERLFSLLASLGLLVFFSNLSQSLIQNMLRGTQRPSRKNQLHDTARESQRILPFAGRFRSSFTIRGLPLALLDAQPWEAAEVVAAVLAYPLEEGPLEELAPEQCLQRGAQPRVTSSECVCNGCLPGASQFLRWRHDFIELCLVVFAFAGRDGPGVSLPPKG